MIFNGQIWCTQLSSPLKLSKKFSEAWTEMMLGSEFGAQELTRKNKEIGRKIAEKIDGKSKDIRVLALNNYIEFVHEGASQPICINYDNENFEELLKKCLNKYKLESI